MITAAAACENEGRHSGPSGICLCVQGVGSVSDLLVKQGGESHDDQDKDKCYDKDKDNDKDKTILNCIYVSRELGVCQISWLVKHGGESHDDQDKDKYYDKDKDNTI